MQGLSPNPPADPARRAARPASAVAPPPLLELQGLLQRFGERTVLEVAAWAVAAGRHSLVLGPSGCGKSTLLHLIATHDARLKAHVAHRLELPARA